MARIITAVRKPPPMSQRQQERVDAILRTYHDWARFPPQYVQDGDDVEIDIEVEDSRAERAASELRMCGFVVRVQTEEEY